MFSSVRDKAPFSQSQYKKSVSMKTTFQHIFNKIFFLDAGGGVGKTCVIRVAANNFLDGLLFYTVDCAQ